MYQLTVENMLLTEVPFRDEILTQIEICRRAGLKKKVKSLTHELKMRTIAFALESKQMSLIHFNDYGWRGQLKTISSNGTARVMRDSSGFQLDFTRQKLSDFIGNIPPQIMEQIPANAGDKAYIFSADVDPIIALKINLSILDIFTKIGYYAAIWEWE